MADDPKKPYGDVTYADPGYQEDGKKRYPLDSEEHCRAAWSYINMPKNASAYSSSQLASIKTKIKAALKKFGVQVSKEGTLARGERAVETVSLDGQVLEAKESTESGNRIFGIKVIQYGTSKNGRRYPESVMRQAMGLYEGAKVYDHHRTTAELQSSTINGVVGFLRNVEAQSDGLYADLHLLPSASHAAEALDASLALQQEGLNPLVGISHDVLARFRRSTEGGKSVHEATRIEAVQSADIVAQPAAGGSAVRAIAGGEDMEEGAVPELSQELIDLLNSVSDDQLNELGLSRASAEEDEDELVGAGAEAFPTKKKKKPTDDDKKASADKKAAADKKASDEKKSSSSDSSDSGSGGSMPPLNSPENCKKALAWVSANASKLGPEKVAALKEKIKAAMSKFNSGGGGDSAKESWEYDLDRLTEADETYVSKNSWFAKSMVRDKCDEANLSKSASEAVLNALPERFTESDLDAQIALGKSWIAQIERDGLKPSLPKPGEGVTQESFDKKKKALDGFFDGDFSGYHSFVQAYADITGKRPDISEDFSRQILHESAGYRPENRTTRRSTESMDTTTWNLVLGDSITRKMVAEYNQPGLKDWQAIVSSTVPVNDFRTQRIDRIGGYDLLPGVNQGAPYQPLTSPDDEEVTYALTKRGGTEDITLEMIANDDVRSISRIPKKLGLSAALTLHRFVWGFLTGSGNIYDSTALFTSGHKNLGTAAVPTQSSLAAVRAAMRKQLAYGDNNNILSIVPRTLVVPTSYEEIAFQLTNSAVAVPGTTNAGNAAAAASDTPNLHKGLNYIVLDHITDDGTSATKWYMVADTSQCPTIEMGFYQGKDNPELFTQADNSVGSMFDADKLTYKIRHIYSGAVLDYRGFYARPVA